MTRVLSDADPELREPHPSGPIELAAPGPRRPRAPRRRRWSWRRLPLYAFLALAAIAFAYPLIWLVSASLKPRGEVFDNRLIPQTLTFDNYLQVWTQAPVAIWLLNTVIVTVLAASAVTLSSAMVAWGFAHFRFPFRGALFGLVLATMMLPAAVTMIPTFLIWNSLGLVGTLVPMWAHNLFGSAFYIFLIRQFLLALPRDWFDAARIDGASQWTVFWRIGLPLIRPALVVTFIFEVQAVWTDLMRSLIYLRGSSTFTLPRGLKSLVDAFGFGGEWHWETIVTASVIATVPIVVLFLIAQRHFVRGISGGGLR